MVIVKIVGGLGNQLFQYAAGRALSIKLNTELFLDLTFYNDKKYNNVFRLMELNLPYNVASTKNIKALKNYERNLLARILKKIGVKLYPFFKSSHIKESQILKILSSNDIGNKNYYLEGWLQDERYFREYREIIIADLSSENLTDRINRDLLNLVSTSNSVSIHIRRGDYLSNDFFNNLSKTYYLSAIEYIKTMVIEPKFFFFSDDIDWVKNEYNSISEAFFIEANKYYKFDKKLSDINDLILMANCKHNIIANSSFSWWGAWLNENKNKIVIAPKKWYNDEDYQNKMKKTQLIPSSWITL